MIKRIAGIDEAGRGPLAGPVVAAVCVFEEGYKNSRVKDSKQLSARMRELVFEEIICEALDWAIVSVGPRRIEQLNIRQATKLAMSTAANSIKADLILVDGDMQIDTETSQLTVIGGDRIHPEISAASILAKVCRDRIMRRISANNPRYGFERHAGYPTAEHQEIIKLIGPCKAHRKTFKGVREFFE